MSQHESLLTLVPLAARAVSTPGQDGASTHPGLQGQTSQQGGQGFSDNAHFAGILNRLYVADEQQAGSSGLAPAPLTEESQTSGVPDIQGTLNGATQGEARSPADGDGILFHETRSLTLSLEESGTNANGSESFPAVTQADTTTPAHINDPQNSLSADAVLETVSHTVITAPAESVPVQIETGSTELTEAITADSQESLAQQDIFALQTEAGQTTANNQRPDSSAIPEQIVTASGSNKLVADTDTGLDDSAASAGSSQSLDSTSADAQGKTVGLSGAVTANLQQSGSQPGRTDVQRQVQDTAQPDITVDEVQSVTDDAVAAPVSHFSTGHVLPEHVIADPRLAQGRDARLLSETRLFAGILNTLDSAGDTARSSLFSRGVTGEFGRIAENALADNTDADSTEVQRFSFLRLPINRSVVGESIKEGLSEGLNPGLTTATQAVSRAATDAVEFSGRDLLANAVDRSLSLLRASQLLESGGETQPVLRNDLRAASAIQPLQSAAPVETPLRPGQSDWPSTFAARVVWLVEGGRETADLRLDPPQLGQLSVRVKLEGEQANLSFQSPHSHVRDLVEASLPRLRELLSESGYSLADFDVSDNSEGQQQAGNGSGFGEHDERFAGDGSALDAATEDSVKDTPVKASGLNLIDKYA